MKYTKPIRIYRLAALIVVGVVSIVCLPIFPIYLPEDVWSEDLFHERRAGLESLAKLLNQDYLMALASIHDNTENTGGDIDDLYTYQLCVWYGSVTGRRSLLFGNIWSKSELLNYAFPCSITGEIPYLEYEESGWRANLSPKDYDRLMAWASNR